MNPSRNIKIDKVTLNIGAGKDQAKLDKGMKLLKNITNVSPVKTVTSKRIPGWGLRPGLPIGCKVTLRRKNAVEVLRRLVQAKDNKLRESQFDPNGNIAFGIEEYIDIPGVKYDPEIGIMGLEVCVTLERNGFRIKRRRIAKKKVPKKHMITKQDAIDFMKKEFNIELEGN
ncbi:MAG: 50S ribosomal protein L5 [Nanoarchaeota archaeon]|nr:50S ribosomal protein L5 [Nanoarchaeota archaeon]MBU4283868.1 50S ribosomal protein L5 [Nanoarchaeota archaeon]MBU4493602.1 50S ribosomal protein L5 [Nanoarchaeota archaeon]